MFFSITWKEIFYTLCKSAFRIYQLEWNDGGKLLNGTQVNNNG
jgi:hypothetical protein